MGIPQVTMGFNTEMVWWLGWYGFHLCRLCLKNPSNTNRWPPYCETSSIAILQGRLGTKVGIQGVHGDQQHPEIRLRRRWRKVGRKLGDVDKEGTKMCKRWTLEHLKDANKPFISDQNIKISKYHWECQDPQKEKYCPIQSHVPL